MRISGERENGWITENRNYETDQALIKPESPLVEGAFVEFLPKRILGLDYLQQRPLNFIP
jgi:hypothetical protein